jgi:hypothetical protein
VDGSVANRVGNKLKNWEPAAKAGFTLRRRRLFLLAHVLHLKSGRRNSRAWDKAAQRVQRKLARDAGISLDGTDEFGNPIDGVDEFGNPIDGVDETVNPIDGANEPGETAKPADEATGAKE